MNSSSFTHPLNGILILSMGIGLGIYLTHRFKLGWQLWLIGALTFILSQVGHIPFNSLVLNPMISNLLEMLPETWHLPIIAMLLGLSAGIFEEFSRYAVYRWWAKDARTWSQGLVFGAGHGGLEAILIGVFTLYTYAQIVALQNVDLNTAFPPEQVNLAQQQIAQYWSMPWYDSLMGSVERAFAIPLHLAAALLVLQAFTRKQFRWVWLAVGLHTLVNAVAVYLSQTVGVYWAELAIGILAAFGIAIILLLRQSTPTTSPEPSVNHSQLLQTKPIQEIPETPENLEQTRYQ